MRRTIMRYVCLSLTMVFRVLSPRVAKRFPKMSDLIDAGLLLQNELDIFEDLDRKFPGFSKNWLPICWAANLVTRARDEGRIRDDFAVKTLIDELNKFRGSCGVLLCYDTICIPLVYLQVVTIAVYTYFLTAMFTEQYTHKDGEVTDKYFYLPDLITLQFIFYMGWLKVAETMMNPFGDDDDDFEVNYMIDRNLQMSYLIVDEMHNEHPELLKDQYWNEIPQTLLDRHQSHIDLRHKKTKERTDVFDVRDEKGASDYSTMTEIIAGSGTKVGESQRSRQSGSQRKIDSKLIPRGDVISNPNANSSGSKLNSAQLKTGIIRIQNLNEVVEVEDITNDETSEEEIPASVDDVNTWSFHPKN
jgi:hypothetical protein